MSETATQEATPRRLARARQRWGRPSSQELTAAVALGVAALALPSLASSLLAAVRKLWDGALFAARSPQLQASGALDWGVITDLARFIAGALAAVAVAAGAVTALQRGVFFRFAGSTGAGSEPAIPAESVLARIRRAAFSSARWLVFVAALFWPWSEAVSGMLGVWQRAPHELLPIAGHVLLLIVSRAAIVLAVLGVIDFAVQQVAFRRRLKMSRQDLKEEQRATEADPHAKAERQRRAREFATAVTLRELDEVVLVVCDAEGRAIGLRATPEAIAVWIKASGDLATRLRIEATARGIVVAFDAELTVVLESSEIGEPLPAALRAAARGHLPDRK